VSLISNLRLSSLHSLNETVVNLAMRVVLVLILIKMHELNGSD
jgi:hypothetical protein